MLRRDLKMHMNSCNSANNFWDTDWQNYLGDQNETVQLGLLSGICVLSLLLILQTVAVAVFIYKVKSSARNAIKKDINLIYGVEVEEETEDKILGQPLWKKVMTTWEISRLEFMYQLRKSKNFLCNARKFRQQIYFSQKFTTFPLKCTIITVRSSTWLLNMRW